MVPCLRARVARGLLASALVAFASVLSASCVGLFELDGYAGAVADLCAKLRDCYGESYYPGCEASGDKISGASPEARTSWLASFAENHCLESCATARACLDMPPLCGAVGSGCAQKEQCCGFLTGLGECGAGSCCRPEGVACASSTECCNGAACENGVCGGVACLLAGESCSDGGQCCSGICDPVSGTCSDEICLPDMSPCEDHFECCSSYCNRSGGGLGVCQPASCVPAGLPCDGGVHAELAGLEVGCCDPLFCVSNPNSGEEVCSPGQCLPKGQLCGTGEECCSGQCDPVDDRCVESCGDAPAPCIGDPDCCAYAECGDKGTCCRKSTAPCIADAQCCSGTCRDFQCVDEDCGLPGDSCSNDPTGGICCSKSCSPIGNLCCAAPDCHHICQEGGPLGFGVNCGSTDMLAQSCITTICSNPTLEYCCCESWDAKCVDAVGTLCAMPCPTPAIEDVPN